MPRFSGGELPGWYSAITRGKIDVCKLGEFSFACERCRYHGGAPGAHAQVVRRPAPAPPPNDLSHCPSALRCRSHVPNANVELSGEARQGAPQFACWLSGDLTTPTTIRSGSACQSLNACF